MIPRRLLPVLLAACFAAGLAVPAIASASHEQGGSITASFSSLGRLQGTLTYLTTGTCTVGQPASIPAPTVKSPTNVTKTLTLVGAKYTRCLPNSTTASATFDADMDTLYAGSVPDGAYTVTFSSCCRVGSITNTSNSNSLFVARVTKNGLTPSSAPIISSDVATGVAKGYAYSQNLNAFDPDGTAVTYESRAGQADGPNTDVVAISTGGQVTIPAATTNTFSNGQFYVYKVRVVDAIGDFTERDVLLRVTDNNAPPTITGIAADPYTVSAGTTRTITFGATDPNNASPKIDTVSLAGSKLPSWATLQTTPGNPASATLTLSPPVDTGRGTVGFNIDAVDSDATVPLFASANIQVKVAGPTPAAPSIDQAPSNIAQVSTFTFSTPADTTAECRVDGGDWVACTSPFAPTGLADGAHTFAVRTVDADGQLSDETETAWTLDTTAPAAPAFTAGPVAASTSKTATFEWTTEPGASFECNVDGDGWKPCAAPYALTGLSVGKHSFSVRQTDAAGNVSSAGVNEWTVGEDAAPATPPRSVAAVLGQGATVAVKGDAASVGCQVDIGNLASCVVDVYAHITGGNSGFGLSKTAAASSGLVKIGTGHVTNKKGAPRLAVGITLNAVGHKLMANKLAGIPVVLKIYATTIEGPQLQVRKNAKLIPAHQLIVPTEGLFASGKAKIQPKAAKLLKGIAKQLHTVKATRCIGHTDSLGTASTNEKLGYERARAVCAALRKYGVRTSMSVASAGERQPRATNATVRGRSLNRRVEISVRYR